MVFSSPVFLFVFLPVLLAAYYGPFRAGRRYRNAVLLLASLLFYAWGEPTFVFVMLAEVAANWLCGLGIARAGRRWRDVWFWLAVAVDVGLLFVYKYLSFLDRTWLSIFGGTHRPLGIALPIGISFFTFQILSYVIDLRRGSIRVQKRPDDLCLYVALFPQLVAGPIVRYADVKDAILDRRESFRSFSEGVARFVVGLGKKVLVANYAAVVADNLFLLARDGRDLSAASAWIGAFAYALQIYFDFSGYSDMAIGLGRMFGFRFPENFDHPYAASSVTDFWRRWHVSLSSWFRDYVYIPLGGSRRSPARNVLNLFAVWALTGVWHGANWTFLAWGILYFAALLVERSFGWNRSKAPALRLWTFLVVMAGWVVFRADSLPDAGRYLSLMAGAGGRLLDPMALACVRGAGVLFAAGAMLSLPFPMKAWKAIPLPSGLRSLLEQAALSGLFVLAVLVLFKSTYNPFIYFNF